MGGAGCFLICQYFGKRIHLLICTHYPVYGKTSTYKMQEKKEIGLVLSGGGVRGAAHAAVLKVLEENNLAPTMLSGSSAGAIAGALYAADYTPDNILTFFKENTNVFQWKHFARSKPGILDAEKFAKLFDPWLKGHTFESLSKKMHICVTDVLNGTFRFFSSGELVRPLLASAAVPGVFSPVEIGENWYIDGGTMNNFPIEPLAGRCELLIGSFVSPKETIHKSELSNTLRLINRASDLTFLSSSAYKFGQCDFVFMPQELSRYGTFDHKKVEEIYKVGYEHASRKIGDLLEAIGRGGAKS